jgi:hypothetical protein
MLNNHLAERQAAAPQWGITQSKVWSGLLRLLTLFYHCFLF